MSWLHLQAMIHKDDCMYCKGRSTKCTQLFFCCLLFNDSYASQELMMLLPNRFATLHKLHQTAKRARLLLG